MSNVVPFNDRGSDPKRFDDDHDVASDFFLIEEGLELLAAYRSIGDATVRRSFKASIVAVAESMRHSVG